MDDSRLGGRPVTGSRYVRYNVPPRKLALSPRPFTTRFKERSLSAQLLDGKALAAQIQQEVAQQVADWIDRSSIVPTLVAVLVGENPASRVYVRNKRRACERVGVESRLLELPDTTGETELLERIDQLNHAQDVHGILVQLPLPGQIDAARVLDAVNPRKDVDAFHPENIGRLVQGRPRFLPCTPHGVQQILHHNQIPIAGRHVVIVGRSDIVGKPLALMLMQRDSTLGPSAANASVTVCHSRSQNLAAITRQADILVAAVGQPRLITAEMVKPGAAVIDVGINRVAEGLVGDVDFASVRQVAGHITPVPGGVGPMTIAMLLQNTLTAAKQSGGF
jgi:methylenetetrahydrofolate dehydrogenase (NADP+)/methenyltetrahydrofolate cyclohydrolase